MKSWRVSHRLLRLQSKSDRFPSRFIHGDLYNIKGPGS